MICGKRNVKKPINRDVFKMGGWVMISEKLNVKKPIKRDIFKMGGWVINCGETQFAFLLESILHESKKIARNPICV